MERLKTSHHKLREIGKQMLDMASHLGNGLQAKGGRAARPTRSR